VASDSLLTADVLALVGSETVPVEVVVTRRAVEKGMDLIPPAGPRRAAPDEPGAPVPGSVLIILNGESDRMLRSARPLPNGTLASNEFEFARPLRLGETLVLTTRLADVSERLGGRFGHTLYWRYEDVFASPDRTVVAKAVRTVMSYDTRNAREGEDSV
jgi:hypothetical protein